MHRLVIALTTLLALTGAVFVAAHLLFSQPTDLAAQLAPADTAVYVTITLQPSAAQRMRIEELVQRLPGFGDVSVLDEKIDEVAQNLLGLAGLDYRRDVRPWLGDQVSLLIPAGTDMSAPAVVILAAVRDADAARASLADVEASRGGDFSAADHGGVEVRSGPQTAYAQVDGMLVVAGDAAPVREVIDVHNGAASLGDDARFRDRMAGIEGDRIAAIYADLGALGMETDGLRAAASLIVEGDALVLDGHAVAEPGAAGTDAAAGETDASESLATWMPSDTQVAVVSRDGRSLVVAEDLAALVPGLADIDGVLQAARALFSFGLGMDLDATLDELLDGEAAVGVRALDTGSPTGHLLLRPREPSSALELLDEIAAGLEEFGATVREREADGVEVVSVELADFGTLAYAGVEDVVVVGLGADEVQEVLDAHGADESLADGGGHIHALSVAGAPGDTEIIVDIEAVLRAGGVWDGLPADARDILQRIGGAAATLSDRGESIDIGAALTVE